MVAVTLLRGLWMVTVTDATFIAPVRLPVNDIIPGGE